MRWTGFYIGGGGGLSIINYKGLSSGTFDADGIGIGAPVNFASPFDNDQASAFGTVQIGYDRQLPANFLVGVFADYDFNNDSGTASMASIRSAPVMLSALRGRRHVDHSWTVGGRLGYLVNPSLLFYGLAGWTHADLHVSGIFGELAGAPLVAFSAKDELDALTVGGGIETLLRPGLSLKVEYRFTDLGGLSAATPLTTLGPAGGTGGATTKIDTEAQTVRAVLTWRPQW